MRIYYGRHLKSFDMHNCAIPLAERLRRALHFSLLCESCTIYYKQFKKNLRLMHNMTHFLISWIESSRTFMSTSWIWLEKQLQSAQKPKRCPRGHRNIMQCNKAGAGARIAALHAPLNSAKDALRRLAAKSSVFLYLHEVHQFWLEIKHRRRLYKPSADQTQSCRKRRDQKNSATSRGRGVGSGTPKNLDLMNARAHFLPEILAKTLRQGKYSWMPFSSFPLFDYFAFILCAVTATAAAFTAAVWPPEAIAGWWNPEQFYLSICLASSLIFILRRSPLRFSNIV